MSRDLSIERLASTAEIVSSLPPVRSKAWLRCGRRRIADGMSVGEAEELMWVELAVAEEA